MRRLAVRTAAVIAAAALALAGCSSSGGSSAHHTAAASGTAGTAGAAATAPGTPVAPATLAAQVRRGLRGVHSLHVALDLSLAGQRSTVTADETLDAGRVTALRASTPGLGGSGPLTLVVAGGRTYGKLPAALNHTGKPWLVISPSSTNAQVAQLASSIDFALGALSIDRAVGLLGAATSAGRLGPATVAGGPTTHYVIVVSVAKLPADFPGRDLIRTAGLSRIPANVYLDAHGRPVQVSQALSVGGQRVSVRIVLSGYDQPVTITAPPADQIGTG